MRLNARWLLVAAAGVVPAFLAGYLIAVSVTPDPVPEPEPQPIVATPEQTEPTPVFPNLELGPRPNGQWKWRDLRGGECIDPFDDPFAEEFQVVSCGGPYEAALARVEVMNPAPGAPYPGDDAIRQRAQEQCDDWDLGTLIGADRYDDLLVVPSYSLGERAWQRGDRLLGCFLYRSSGPLTGELLG